MITMITMLYYDYYAADFLRKKKEHKTMLFWCQWKASTKAKRVNEKFVEFSFVVYV